MAKASLKRTRKLHPQTPKPKFPIGIAFVDIAGVYDLTGEFKHEERVVSHRIHNEEAFSFRVSWEYNSNQHDFPGSTEFFHATFTSEQLFELAAKAGLLTTTTSILSNVRKGVAAAMRLIDTEAA